MQTCKDCGRILAGLIVVGVGGRWFCNKTCADRWEKAREDGKAEDDDT